VFFLLTHTHTHAHTHTQPHPHAHARMRAHTWMHTTNPSFYTDRPCLLFNGHIWKKWFPVSRKYLANWSNSAQYKE